MSNSDSRHTTQGVSATLADALQAELWRAWDIVRTQCGPPDECSIVQLVPGGGPDEPGRMVFSQAQQAFAVQTAFSAVQTVFIVRREQGAVMMLEHEMKTLLDEVARANSAPEEEDSTLQG